MDGLDTQFEATLTIPCHDRSMVLDAAALPEGVSFVKDHAYPVGALIAKVQLTHGLWRYWFGGNYGHHAELGKQTVVDMARMMDEANNNTLFVFHNDEDRLKAISNLRFVYGLITTYAVNGRSRWSDYGQLRTGLNEPNGAWRHREAEALYTEKYTCLPKEWLELEWTKGSVIDPSSPNFHYPHISVHEAHMLAFTENDEKGVRDIQKRMKAGRYLKQFFGDKLNELYGDKEANAIIARMAAQFGHLAMPDEVKFATTPDEIERVYTNGPTSCMSHSECDYSSDQHPVRVFGAGDLAVAYIEREGRGITARALCWPERKVWVRIYGDEHRLAPALRYQGFSQGGNDCLDGAKLLKIKQGRAFVMPYIDYHDCAGPDGEFLVIGQGDLPTQNTNGLTADSYRCVACETDLTNDNYVAHGDVFCEDCFNERYFYCDRNGDLTSRDDEVCMEHGESWSQYAFDEHGFTCDQSGGNWPNTKHYAVNMENGETWCKQAFREFGLRTEDGRNLTKKEWEEEALEQQELELESK
jgi:hypothetical protein